MRTTIIGGAIIVLFAAAIYGGLVALDWAPSPWGSADAAPAAASAPAETPEQGLARERREAEAAAQWAAAKLAAVAAAEEQLAGQTWRVAVDAGTGADALLRLADGELIGARGILFPEFRNKIGVNDRLTVVVPAGDGGLTSGAVADLRALFGARLRFEDSNGAALYEKAMDPGPQPK